MSRTLVTTLSALTALAACKPEAPPETTEGASETDGQTTGATGEPTTGDTNGGSIDDEKVVVSRTNAVDILFVIDNSGSMARAQAALSEANASLLNALEEHDVPVNYRIGFTTTDAGNPRCPKAVYNPEGGRLVLSSCVDRVAQGEFTFNMNDFSYACTDYCDLTDAQLQIKPTATQFSNGQEEPRKWIESNDGETNLPDDYTPSQAFHCFAPQGVAGCGFEQHLESMYLAIAQSSRADSPTNYGFLRDEAVLAVVLVSDETDCSFSQLGAEIFTTNKVFWNDPSDPAPTSAICWRAGVECQGAGPAYDFCYSTNRDLQGDSLASDDEAVLQPLGRYINFMQGIEDQKRLFDASQEVLVTLFTGVPEGYDEGLAELVYEDSLDVDWQSDFGIGPGCARPDPNGGGPIQAVPPVREREFAEAFSIGDDRPLSSICAEDFSAGLQRLGARITDQIKPMCVPVCIADADPTTVAVEPNCKIYQEVALVEEELSPCDVVGGALAVPAGQTACYGMRVDGTALTPSLLDDLSSECVVEGFNAEVVVVRTAPAPVGARIIAQCERSTNKAKDCPNL